MSIKVIKHGKETFKAVCPICGCEFTYQSEDLKEDCFHNHYVDCPDCKNSVSHEYEPKKKSLDDSLLWEYAKSQPLDSDKYPAKLIKEREFYVDYKHPTTIWNSWPDCATCPNKPDPTKTIVGDTSCTWCIKNQPYCTGMDSDFVTASTNYTTDLGTHTFDPTAATYSCEHIKNINKK